MDAIFGTGLTKEVAGVEAAVIEEINRSGKPVIAVDIPSGLDGTSGLPLGVAVRATHTYTYGHPKLGQLFHPGVSYTGRLTVIDISLPAAAASASGSTPMWWRGRCCAAFSADGRRRRTRACSAAWPLLRARPARPARPS